MRAYIAAMPGWKQAVGQEIDRIVTDSLSGVRKAVKWNSPLYGTEDGGAGDNGWFLSFHRMTRHIKVAFLRGALPDPPPPEPSKQAEVRYLHIPEAAQVNEAQLAGWIRQAARLPGVRM